MAKRMDGKIVDGGDMASNITSDTIDAEDRTLVSIQLHAASATHVGTVAVQGSNDDTNWNAIPLSSTPTAASGSAFDALVELSDVSCRYLRIVYTATSGAGSLTATVSCK